MKGDDGAIEKELTGTVGDNGGINDCLPGTHAFPRSRRPRRPTGAAVSLPKKPAKSKARPGDPALRPPVDRAARPGQRPRSRTPVGGDGVAADARRTRR